MAEWSAFIQQCKTDATNLAQSYQDDLARVLESVRTGVSSDVEVDPNRGINFVARIEAAVVRMIELHANELEYLRNYRQNLDKRAERIAAREHAQAQQGTPPN